MTERPSETAKGIRANRSRDRLDFVVSINAEGRIVESAQCDLPIDTPLAAFYRKTVAVAADGDYIASGMDDVARGRRAHFVHEFLTNGDAFRCTVAVHARSVGRARGAFVVNDASARSAEADANTDREIIRMNRALRMLSRCNEALNRQNDEARLLEEVCRIAVEIGGYRMAMVGFARDDAEKAITPAAVFGDTTGYFNDVRISWSDNDPSGHGPAGRTIRSGRPTIVANVELDPLFAPWIETARRHGYAATGCWPLREGTRTFGVLGLYSATSQSTTADESQLLQEMADDLAFGIMRIRSRSEQRRTQDAIMKVAAAVSVRASDEFFEQLVRAAMDALGAQAGFIARLDPHSPGTARTVVSMTEHARGKAFDYRIAGTPCAQLLSVDSIVVTEHVEDGNADAASLHGFQARAYVGHRLVDGDGKLDGFFCLLFRDTIVHADFARSTIRIFAARVSAELERQRAEAHISHQASLLDKARDAIIVRDMNDRVVFWNKSAEQHFGWSSQEALGHSIVELLYEEPREYREAMQELMINGDWSAEIDLRRRDGSSLIVESRWTLVADEAGTPRSILSISTDITERKAAERAIEQLAFYDGLTRLPNRSLLLNRLRKVLTVSTRTGTHAALLFLDLDNFKTLNDTLGHDIGDLLLAAVGERLSACVRERDTVSRFGGDEFVVLLHDLSGDRIEAAHAARLVSEHILEAFHAPFILAGFEHTATASVGVTIFSGTDKTEDILKQADLAMYHAKEVGRNTFRFFDPEMQAIVSARHALESDLRAGLKNNEFRLAFQPQVDETGRTIGAEALLRWEQRVGGSISPCEFIPIAETSGLIRPLGQWVIETACAQLASWGSKACTADLTLSVNVSAREFRQTDFFERLCAVLASSHADPTKLKIELTESVLLDDIEATIVKMKAFKTIGIGFSLDDFGTGYSSLQYIKRLPIDEIKIDHTFIENALTNPSDAAIARTIIALTRTLDLHVIAEGVETEEQRAFLAENGCRSFQGYLFSRPLSTAAFEAFVSRVPAGGRT